MAIKLKTSTLFVLHKHQVLLMRGWWKRHRSDDPSRRHSTSNLNNSARTYMWSVNINDYIRQASGWFVQENLLVVIISKSTQLGELLGHSCAQVSCIIEWQPQTAPSPWILLKIKLTELHIVLSLRMTQWNASSLLGWGKQSVARRYLIGVHSHWVCCAALLEWSFKFIQHSKFCAQY